jgi:hypothetical protein
MQLVHRYGAAHCAPDEAIALFNRRDGGICLFLMQRYEEAVEELTVGGGCVQHKLNSVDP